MSISEALIELSVVMPCLNERRTVGECIDKATRSIERLGLRGEVIVADNGSTDGSIERARQRGARLVPVGQRGYGAALQGGIAAARGTFVIMGDCDNSYDFDKIDPFIDRLTAGYDLVMGNRFTGGIQDRAMPALHRYVGNPVLTRLGKLLFQYDCGDVYCGLRGFRREAVEKLDLRSPGMEFALEMLVKASKSGLSLTEVPTTLSPDGRDGQPHLRTWRDGWRSLRFLLRVSRDRRD